MELRVVYISLIMDGLRGSFGHEVCTLRGVWTRGVRGLVFEAGWGEFQAGGYLRDFIS